MANMDLKLPKILSLTLKTLHARAVNATETNQKTVYSILEDSCPGEVKSYEP
jgi:hypothetical protein